MVIEADKRLIIQKLSSVAIHKAGTSFDTKKLMHDRRQRALNFQHIDSVTCPSMFYDSLTLSF